MSARGLDGKPAGNPAWNYAPKASGAGRVRQGLAALSPVLALILLLALTGLGLSGCGAGVPLAAAAGIEGMSLNQTGKTATDHLASWVTGEDCSIMRYTKNGKYCRTTAEIAQEQAQIHRPYDGDCYRTRGGVACYTQTDATHTSETQVYTAP